MPRPHNDRQRIEQSAERTKRYLIAAVVFLIAIDLALILRVGQAVWPAWMVAYRTQLIGLVLLGTLVTVIASPLIVEVSSNPRHLSGPGHNPEQGPTQRRMP
jgi:hypothetical protein